MSLQTKVSAVILAGGQAQRMNHRDKGLVHLHGRPMISYVLAAVEPLVDQVLVNANRNHAIYEQFGWPVIADSSTRFDGPLAGILAALRHTDADILLVAPCDSPFIKTAHLRRLLAAQAAQDADVAVAFDGERLHPVFLAIKTGLKASLQDYLDSGQRKIGRWLEQHSPIKVDFSDEPAVFANVNTLTELAAWEAKAV
ncbi:MAG: molybdenum cofactor guanylyltransferase [Gammaproteobacteria bacterium HGW-Gammaproteobacteria-3]|jgi:molybdopterin-guanine dinucleotide biosynthesis protein A|nr:MAG: molybdenum cofactor guanylyltransferase [Gammaproteobacteria bacterium HGW-Gammaproteobacteria-3]